MARKKITQRQATLLRLQVESLTRQIRNQRSTWHQEYRGVEIARAVLPNTAAAVTVARKLGHAVVVVGDNTDTLRFVALPHPEEPVL